jgi:hypothetical protein
MKITKTQLKQIIKEEMSKVLREGEYDIDTGEERISPEEIEREKQEAAEKEMETYLIEKGVYEGDRNGRIEIFTGIVGEARDVLDDAVAKGLFKEYAVMRFINKLHRMIR